MPPESARSQVTRLLAMMSYLGEHGEASLEELAAHFGIPVPKLLDDIYLLWVTGAPGYLHGDLIDFALDEDEGYVALLDSQGLPRRVPFAPREALALAAAVEWLRASGAATGKAAEALGSVREKLRGLVPAELVGEGAEDSGQQGTDDSRRQQVVEAASAGLPLALRYVSAEDQVTERTVFPEVLTTDGVHWYLDAWCTRARARRTFRMDRILTCTTLPADAATHPDSLPHPDGGPPVPDDGASPAPEQPAGAVEPGAVPGADGAGPTSEQPAGAGEGGDPAPTTVRLVLHPRARWLAEEIPGAKVRSRGGALHVEVTLGRWDWLVRALLGIGDAVQSVSPPQFAQELRSRAAAALEAYGSGPAPQEQVDPAGGVQGGSPPQEHADLAGGEQANRAAQ